MEETIVYKVVTKGKKNYYSVNARKSLWDKKNLKSIRKHLHGCLSQYNLGKETKPKKGLGPLLAFKNQESARLFIFMRCDNPEEVATLECKASVSEKDNTPRVLLHLDQLHYVHGFWEGNRWNGYWGPIPSGTVFCDSITPLKAVEEENG